jgi:hypothetical protein
MREYLSLIVVTDRETKRGDGTVYPAGTEIAYHLQYPSLTEAMAHIVCVSRNVGRPVAIVSGDKREAFVLAQSGPTLDPIGWIKSGWGASMRGYRAMCSALRERKLPLLPQWPEQARKDARRYWATHTDMQQRLM